MSKLLGLVWVDLDLRDPSAATVRFTHQLDRQGRRVELKTDGSKATLPLPRAAALMLLEHNARSLHTGPRAFVFATRNGTAIGQRHVLRALYKAQERARKPTGSRRSRSCSRPTITAISWLTARGTCRTRCGAGI